MGPLKLFGEDDDADVLKIEIDEKYAKRLEHNKRREELQKYEEMKKKGLIQESDEESDDGSSESDEDNNDIIGNSKKDSEFFKALLLVKKQDPSLKEKDAKLFYSESDGSEGEHEEEEEESEKKGKTEKGKKKAMYLKDVVAKHLIEEGPEFGEDSKEELGEKKNRKKTYNEEQEEIRKALLDAVKEGERNEEEEDFLKEKKKGDDGEQDVDDDNDEYVRNLDEYFGRDGELDENKMFLRDFFKNKMWIDKEKRNKNEEIVEEVEDLLREEEELERQELYETTFRHEEEVADRVMGHSRKVEGSVRKKENARKEQRKSKEERMKIAEMERKEELKHLKNLKKKEMKERMKKVMTIAGFKEEEDLPLNLKDLDDEFDPEEYDRMMKAVFDAKYYGAEDLDPQFGKDREEDEMDKPDFDKEDELLGLPKGWDVIESGDGFKAARERSLKLKLENGECDDDSEGQSEQEDDDDDSEGQSEQDDDDESDEVESERGEKQEVVYEESRRKRKRKMSLVKKAREEMLEEFYKLDYEDTIGDLKTRFKYAKVNPKRFGLKTEEMLMMDDKELNQYVPVKKLAPYREKEWKVPASKRYEFITKKKDVVPGRKSTDRKGGEKKRLRVDSEIAASGSDAKEDEKVQQEGTNGESKRAKTRRRQAKLKLPQSRLSAYGKIPSNTKSKH